MDFTEDTTRQGKRLGEDVISHSIVEKAKESIFSVNTSKPDLKLLKEAYGFLSSREKHDFEVRFGCIEDLLSMVPDWNLFRAMLKFYSCSGFFYFHSQAQHMKFTLEKVQEMLQAMWEFPFEFSQPWVTTKDDSYGFDRNATLMALGKRLKGITSSQRINFVALGIYGMVIFLIYIKTITPMVVALFEQLSHTSTFNPASTVLFTTWAHGHLRGPQFEALFSVPVKDRKTEDWHQSLLVTTVNDVGFVLPTWNVTQYLAPPKRHYSIPLLGIHGGVTYSVELASSHEVWEKCRMLPIWKENGTRPQYEQWRSSWIVKLSLPWEVTNTKNFTIMDLIAKLELSHAQRCQLLEKYDELALDHELLKRGKELFDQPVAGLKDKIASLERDLAVSKEICGKQTRSLEFVEEQQKKLLRVKADLKAKEKENKELVEKIAMEDMCYQLQVEKQKSQALVEEDTGLREVVIDIIALVTQFEGKMAKTRHHIAQRAHPIERGIFQPVFDFIIDMSNFVLSRVIKMFEENAATNLEKLVVDERVDKLETTMQTMAATLQTINLTLSTLTTGSVPSPASLIPTIPVPCVPTITPGNHVKDPMVTQLQFPHIYENQPLVGESSSHAPQISSLPFEASYPPFEMNNPTLPTTTPLTLNIPPLMGQVPTIQLNPSVVMLRPALEDGKSRKVDHKLQQLEEALKAMDSLQRITRKSNETFKEFAQRWRSEAAKVIPPLANSEIYFLFIKSSTETFRAWQLEQAKMGSLGSTSKKFTPKGQKEDEEALNHIFTNHAKPTYNRRPNFNTPPSVRQQFSHAMKPRQFMRLPIPYSEVLKQLVAVGLLETVQANPVQPPYPYCTMNMVTFDGVEKPVLENTSSWSLDELFVILIEYDLVQPIEPTNLNALPMIIDDALVCLYHSNMKGHTLQDCGDFQRKITELQRMGSLELMSTLESEKFITPVTEEYFTKERPYILQDTTKAQVINQNSQQPYVLKTSLSESFMGKTSFVANSHFPYSLKVITQRSTS
ncbi:hypothetical protein SLEP1_g46828 [Rubroshorea leprosula]|uniref:Uncharacterized protein n=1 Tax=Rubroshorea leprosula TaxID=152421 RepID=A0AAV5LR65_9ROSI|nr:hypothetical protein SLEP1_g46828 [Rubroshorea leprosula]